MKIDEQLDMFLTLLENEIVNGQQWIDILLRRINNDSDKTDKSNLTEELAKAVVKQGTIKHVIDLADICFK